MNIIEDIQTLPFPVAAGLVVAICFGEQLIITSALLPGSLAVIALGFGLARGIGAPALILAVFAGNYLGDLASYFLGRTAGQRLLRYRFLANSVGRCSGRLKTAPWKFLTLSRLSPYLKSVGPFTAGVIGITPRPFLTGNVLCAAIDALWFLGVGYIGSHLVSGIDSSSRFAAIVGAAVIVLLIYFAMRRTSGVNLLLHCAVHLPRWQVVGWLEQRTGYWRRDEFRSASLACLGRAEVGDIALVARHYASPWRGPWTHVALSSGSEHFVHAFQRVLEETAASFPRRYRVLVVRVRCTPEQRQAAVRYARAQLGKPYKLCATKPQAPDAQTFNCCTLVWAAYRYGAGIDLAPRSGKWVTPTNLAESELVEVVCQSVGQKIVASDQHVIADPSSIFAHLMTLVKARSG